MKKFDCPSCLQPTFSMWQKMTLGPSRKIICSNCGVAVRVPWMRSMLIIILASFFPPIGAIAPFFFVSRHESIISLFVTVLVGSLLGLLLLSWFYSRWVPLVAKK